MSNWYKEQNLPLDRKTIFHCKSKEELIEWVDYVASSEYPCIMADGNVAIDTQNDYRHVVEICCSCGREYSEFYGVFQTIGNDPIFLDCYRLGTFDGNPEESHPYVKDELKNLVSIVYDLFRTNPERFEKIGTSYFLKPHDPMYV